MAISATALTSTALRSSARANLAALHLAVFFGLCITYLVFISDIYAYEGYQNSLDFFKLIYSSAIILSITFLISNKRPTRSFILHFGLICSVVPALVLYSCADLPHRFAAYFTLCFIAIICTSRIKFNLPSLFKVNSNQIMYTLSIFTVIFIFSFYRYGSFSTFNLDFNKVYELRRSVAANFPSIYGYLIPLFSKVVIPYIVILSCANRNKILFLASFVFSFIIFGLTTHKSIIFYPAISASLYYSIRIFRADKALLIVIFASILISIVDFYINGSGWISSLIARRIFIVPALLNYYYFDYFSMHDWYLWSNSRITLGLLKMPYDVMPPFQIGAYYFNRPQMSANIGWFGSGYAQAGLLGAALYSIGAGIIISYLDNQSTRIGAAIIIPLFISQIIDMFTATDLLTLFLTSGLFFGLLLVGITGKVPAGSTSLDRPR